MEATPMPPVDDQTSADRDQTCADRDQTASDRDQDAADRDQLASDADQAASDREHFHGVDDLAYESSKEARERTTRERRETGLEREGTAVRRDDTGRERDRAALARDRAAEQRDREAQEHDALSLELENGSGVARARSAREAILRAAGDRRRAAEDRARAAEQRALAAKDRERAARDRLLAAQDRAAAVAERELAETDDLTGALRRRPGLAALQRELDRARRTSAPLVAAFIDVDGLKAVNDSEGHRAGDALLQRVACALRESMRSYDLTIRVGGDEFVCVASGVALEDARARFGMVQRTLTQDAGASFTVGYAELSADDTPTALIDRADSDLLAVRAGTRNGRVGVTPSGASD